MGRLPGFDYKRPFFYMVTLKRAPVLPGVASAEPATAAALLAAASRIGPGEKQERLCAAGRMLYLSPYEPQGAKLDKREMHIRAHALVDWALVHSHDHLEAWP